MSKGGMHQKRTTPFLLGSLARDFSADRMGDYFLLYEVSSVMRWR
jgi:hypothetical protein